MELKTFTLLLLSVVILGCTKGNKNEQKSDDSFPLSKFEFHPDDDEQYFIKDADGFVVFIYSDQLRALYKSRFEQKFCNYDEFRKAVLSGNYVLSFTGDSTLLTSYQERFRVNNSFMKECEKEGVKEILSKYFKKEGKKYQLDKQKVPDKMTVIYYLWQNGYYYGFGCIISDDWVMKLKSSPGLKRTQMSIK
jgi:hypothetical protein